ncbi:MAG: LysM peptidoglycan-binding domain-containing protein, partial [Anaerolineae bacterium]|nr:LysM peptidoglycan-binding domain-containing protein [Anaerolineae bacterium]
MLRSRFITRFILFAAFVCIIAGAFAAFAQGDSYTVQPRDTLDQIAAFYDVQTACLAESNNLAKPSELKVGDIINIDFSCPRYDGWDFVTNPREDAGGGGVSDLGQGGGSAEDAEDGAPQPGPNDTSYTVARGDTLDTIGQAQNISIVSLRLANGLSPTDKIFPGDSLIIPADAAPYGQFPAIANPAALPQNQELGQGGGGTAVAGPGDQLYVVQPLDTLDKIGANFDTQVTCIAQANGLDKPS